MMKVKGLNVFLLSDLKALVSVVQYTATNRIVVVVCVKFYYISPT